MRTRGAHVRGLTRAFRSRKAQEEALVWQGHYDKVYLGGDWATPMGADRISVVSPQTEQEIARVPSASRADVDDAVAAARSPSTTDPGRARQSASALHPAATARPFVARREQIGAAITDEMGSPISFSLGLQTGVPIWMIDAQTEIAKTYPWRQLRQSATGNGLVLREPKGVVVAIVPWNVPMMVTMPSCARRCWLVAP